MAVSPTASVAGQREEGLGRLEERDVRVEQQHLCARPLRGLAAWLCGGSVPNARAVRRWRRAVAATWLCVLHCVWRGHRRLCTRLCCVVGRGAAPTSLKEAASTAYGFAWNRSLPAGMPEGCDLVRKRWECSGSGSGRSRVRQRKGRSAKGEAASRAVGGLGKALAHLPPARPPLSQAGPALTPGAHQLAVVLVCFRVDCSCKPWLFAARAAGGAGAGAEGAE